MRTFSAERFRNRARKIQTEKLKCWNTDLPY
jgi:hypothetical protein